MLHITISGSEEQECCPARPKIAFLHGFAFQLLFHELCPSTPRVDHARTREAKISNQRRDLDAIITL